MVIIKSNQDVNIRHYGSPYINKFFVAGEDVEVDKEVESFLLANHPAIFSKKKRKNEDKMVVSE